MSSALPLKADIAQYSGHFAFVPIRDSSTAVSVIVAGLTRQGRNWPRHGKSKREGSNRPSGVESPSCSRGTISSRLSLSRRNQLCCAQMPVRGRSILQRAFEAELSSFKRNLMGPACGLPTSSIRYPRRMLQADSSQSGQHAHLTERDQFVSSHAGLQIDL